MLSPARAVHGRLSGSLGIGALEVAISGPVWTIELVPGRRPMTITTYSPALNAVTSICLT